MIVFLVALALRTMFFLVATLGPGRAMWVPDSFEYDRLGRNLARYQVFSQSPAPPLVPDLQRVPLFPLQVALAYLLVPGRPDLAVGLAVAGNLLLGALAAALLVTLGTAWGGRRAGLAAGLLLATDLTSLVYATMLLSETLFTLLLVGATLTLTRYGQRPAAALTAAIGALLGLATLTRPIGLFLPLVFAPAFLLARPRRHWPLGLRDLGLCALVLALLVVPWHLRTRAVGGADPATRQAAVNGYFHRGALLEAARSGRDPEEVLAELQASFAREAAANGWTEEEQVRVMQARATRLLADYPALYLWLQARGMLRLLGPETDAIFDVLGLRSTPHDHPVRPLFLFWKVAGMAQLAALYALAAGGLLLLLRARRWFPAAVLVLPLGYFLIVSGPEAYARFRVPLMPGVALLAATALWPGTGRGGKRPA